MDEKIEERVQMIKKNKVPEGYKKSVVGIIPNDWMIKKVSEYVFELNNGISIKAGEKQAGSGEVGILKTSSVTQSGFNPNENKIITNVKDIKKLKFYPKKDNLIIIRKNTPDVVGRVNYIDKSYDNLFLPDLLWQTVFKKNCDLNRKYMYYFFNTKYYNKLLKSLATGTSKSMPNIKKQDFLNIDISISRKDEQDNIVKVLSTFDKAIELKEKLISEKEKQKQGLAERLLTGKVRLGGFDNKVTIKKLNGYIEEVHIRNTQNKENRILSVTNKLGFILQEEQFERVVASENLTNYKIVKRDEFAYNPSRVNVGSIDLLRKYDSGLLSPMYIIFKCKQGLVNEYLYHFVKTKLFLNYIPKLLQGSVRNSLSFDSLKLVSLFIPSIEEQKQIGDILSTADKEITLLKRELQQLKQQKKGLMQLLLTGIVRVKGD